MQIILASFALSDGGLSAGMCDVTRADEVFCDPSISIHIHPDPSIKNYPTRQTFLRLLTGWQNILAAASAGPWRNSHVTFRSRDQKAAPWLVLTKLLLTARTGPKTFPALQSIAFPTSFRTLFLESAVKLSHARSRWQNASTNHHCQSYISDWLTRFVSRSGQGAARQQALWTGLWSFKMVWAGLGSVHSGIQISNVFLFSLMCLILLIVMSRCHLTIACDTIHIF